MYRMGDDGFEGMWVQGVLDYAEYAASGKKDDIHGKDDPGDSLKPVAIVWEDVKKDRDNANPHDQRTT